MHDFKTFHKMAETAQKDLVEGGAPTMTAKANRNGTTSYAIKAQIIALEGN